MRLLGGRPDRDAFGAAVEFGHDAAPFDRMAGAAVLPEIGMERMRGVGEGGVGIAEIHLVGGDRVGIELAPHCRRAGRERLAAIGDGGQQVVVDVDQGRGVLGNVAAVGDDDGDGLAHIGHLAVGEGEAPHAVERRAGIGMPHHAALGHHRREVVEREHRMHAGQRQRGVLRYAADRGMRMRAAHKAGMQNVRHDDVVDEAALAAQQRRVLDSVDARTDQRSHGCSTSRSPGWPSGSHPWAWHKVRRAACRCPGRSRD